MNAKRAHRAPCRARGPAGLARESRYRSAEHGRELPARAGQRLLPSGEWRDRPWRPAARGDGRSQPHGRGRRLRHGRSRRGLHRLRDVFRHHSRWPSGHDGARRAAGGRARLSRELDGARQDGAGHGGRHGSCRGSEACHCGHGSHREGNAQNRPGMRPAADGRAPRQPHRGRNWP